MKNYMIGGQIVDEDLVYWSSILQLCRAYATLGFSHGVSAAQNLCLGSCSKIAETNLWLRYSGVSICVLWIVLGLRSNEDMDNNAVREEEEWEWSLPSYGMSK